MRAIMPGGHHGRENWRDPLVLRAFLPGVLSGLVVLVAACATDDLLASGLSTVRRTRPASSEPTVVATGLGGSIPTDGASPARTPDASGSPAPASTPQASGSPSVAVTAEPTATPEPAATATPTTEPTTEPTPAATPTPTPTAEPTLTPTPVPTPTPTPEPSPIRVVVFPKAVSLNVPDPGGSNSAGFSSAALLAATVTLSNGQTIADVTWSTSDAGRVSVGPDGLAKVVDGALPGVVIITASTGDGQGELADTVAVTVTNLGGIHVIVE